MILDFRASDTLEQFKQACKEEEIAITTLHTYILLPETDEGTLMDLGRKMEATHTQKMILWKQLQELRLDK